MASSGLSHCAHIHEIERTCMGAASERDELVIESWRRCVQQHRLDPAQSCEAYIVPDGQLREHRQQSEELISIARSGLEQLFLQVAGQNYVLLLADPKGVTVEFLGNAKQREQLRKAGLYLGSEWSEERAGTCGIGACLQTGEVLCIHQSDHFDNTHTALSCTAAPIYETDGHLAAILDLSLLSSPIRKASQNLAQHLIASSVRRIELANLMAHSARQWVLRFAHSPEFLDVDPESAISLDESGRIVGMTHAAARLLAQSGGLDWRQPEAIIGQPLSAFFELELSLLPEYVRHSKPQDRLIVARDGNRLFAHAIEPQRVRCRRPQSLVKSAVPQALRQLEGGDPSMCELTRRAGKLCRSRLPILLHGETGSGKEYLARAIHQASGRKGAYVAINCAAIPESLIESELFGHAPGAYTGASSKGRKGLIEEADDGTLFLDEIGDMPLSLQGRLLRVLAESEIRPVGSNQSKQLQLSLLCASHRDLAALVKEGRFRQDLFYRINAACLAIPPLRERQDLRWLIAHLLAAHQDTDGLPQLSPQAWLALENHDWPGNIRELVNVLAVAVALCEGEQIELEHLPDELTSRISSENREEIRLKAMLEHCAGNISETARRLGVDRCTVYRQMRRLGVQRPL